MSKRIQIYKQIAYTHEVGAKSNEMKYFSIFLHFFQGRKLAYKDVRIQEKEHVCIQIQSNMEKIRKKKNNLQLKAYITFKTSTHIASFWWTLLVRHRVV